MAATSEVLRQLVHVAMGGFAFALGALTWWQAAALAAAAVAVNRYVLRALAPRLFRDGDHARGWGSGIVLYPLAVLALVLVFRTRLDLAAVAWVILAAGDGCATLIGAHLRSARLPWNRGKSVAGLTAFVVAGGAAALTMIAWMPSPPAPAWWLAAVAIGATVVAAVVETAPIRLDDNVSVPAAAGVVLWSMSQMDPAIVAGAWPAVRDALPLALGVNALVAAAGWAARTVTVAGAIAGAAIGTVIAVGAGWAGWALLIAAFVVASVMTKLGYQRKAARGIAEARGGRRGPANAIANTGVAAWAALVALGMVNPSAAWLALTAALVTGASDTVASEIGKGWGRRTRLVVGLRPVPAGTSGAVSTEGTAAGVAAAGTLATLAWALGLIAAPAIAIVAVAATLASLAEGAMGATLESSGILDNDALNLLNTLIGAGLALAMLPLI